MPRSMPLLVRTFVQYDKTEGVILSAKTQVEDWLTVWHKLSYAVCENKRRQGADMSGTAYHQAHQQGAHSYLTPSRQSHRKKCGDWKEHRWQAQNQRLRSARVVSPSSTWSYYRATKRGPGRSRSCRARQTLWHRHQAARACLGNPLVARPYPSGSAPTCVNGACTMNMVPVYKAGV
eukprot:COSAG05_NODE_23_length_31591_cov_92.542995_4_plen_177_part_00